MRFPLRGRSILTHSGRGSVNFEVNGGAFPRAEMGKKIEAKKATLSLSGPRLFNWKIEQISGGPVKKIGLLKTSVNKNLEGALKLPQERRSRLSYSRNRLKLPPGEIPLAFFFPLIEGGVDNSILNKEKGDLLVWYNRYTRAFSPRGLLLSRRLGRGGGLQWRWTDIN